MGTNTLLDTDHCGFGLLNTTPIVAVFVPRIEQWAKEKNAPPSWYLMPLSFAAILGGLITLTGTSTNIVVSGLLQSSGQPPLSFFELTPVGLTAACLGLLTIIGLAHAVLPKRQAPASAVFEDTQRFLVSMSLDQRSPLVDKTVEAAGLRHLTGSFLAEIVREDGFVVVPVSPRTVLRPNDLLRFVGRSEAVNQLSQIPGLRSAPAGRENLAEASAHYELVVGTRSPTVGFTLKEIGFRERYGAAVLAIFRGGKRLHEQLGRVPLKLGDTLVVAANDSFAERWGDSDDFLLISKLASHRPPLPVRAWLALTIGAAVVGAVATDVLPLVSAALAGAVITVVGGLIPLRAARKAINGDVILTIAAAFGFANAFRNAGLAKVLSAWLLRRVRHLGPQVLLFCVMGLVTVLKELITNYATIMLVLPMAFEATTALKYNPRPFAIGTALAAASFLTPVGYQTNTMVMGPGGYRYTDYLRLGLPVTAAVYIAAFTLVPRLFPFAG